jgi:hypothetical protein
MKQKTSQSLYAYWNKVRADRNAPRRFEIEPFQIGTVLPYSFILEKTDRETFRFRLAGTAICDHFGQEFRGTNFLDGWDEEDQISLTRLLAVVTVQGGVVVLDIEAETASKKCVTFEILILPLVHTRETIDRVLGAMSPVALPDWLGHETIRVRRLLRSEVIWPNGRPLPVLDAAKRQAPLLPHIRKARIVRSDRRQFRVYDGGLADKARD